MANAAVVDNGNLQTVQLNIEGMTCGGCTEHVNAELAKVNGVVDYETSYEKGTTVVTFDPTVTPADSLVSAVGKTGYTVTSRRFVNAVEQ